MKSGIPNFKIYKILVFLSFMTLNLENFKFLNI